MSILETALTVAGSVLGGGALGALATARAKSSAARDASATAVVKPLLDRVESLEKDRDEDRRELKSAHESYMNAMQSMRDGMESTRKADREACDKEIAKRIAEVRADLGTVASRVRDSLDASEVTGLHALERIVRRSPTPPEPMEAQPGPKPALMLREIPPPPRGPKENR